MVLRIDKMTSAPQTVYLLSGHLESTDLAKLKEILNGGGRKVALDLEQVQLVDADAVLLLAVAELKGVELRNCPEFVRRWIQTETSRITGMD